MKEKEYLTAKEVAKLLQLHPQTIYRLADKGELHCSKIGGTLRFPKKEIERRLLQWRKEDE